MKKVINFQNGVGHERSIDENGNVVVVNSKFISTEGTVRKYTDKVLSIIPDDSLCMVMSDIPNGKAIAKCYYFEKGDYFSLNQRICSIKSETEVNKFLFYRINRHKYYLKFDNGVGQTNLRKSEVLNCPIKFPSLPEQQKIADFLTAVDKRIELLEKKKTLLETYKKGVMKKIFNQEIRFKDDNGNEFPDWEEKRLEDVLNYEQPTKYLVDSTDYSDSYDLPVLTAGKSFILGYTNETTGVYSNLPTIIFDDFTTSFHYVDFEFKMKSSAMKMLTVKSNNYNLKLVFEIMKNLRFVLSEHKRYWISEYSQMFISIPSNEEQTKISNFSNQLDTQIELLETQIDKSKTWKKGLLQKMFV
ncbi:restriction endonuclease subunit S [Polaribacter tangerinus]|uniref:restriction endonuclease subunit S n=1 Tax=Polaribacter tangerinus TaxID=1920034 RepID=UPI000B4ACB13|nr:restriction endonuclease subunit S [Polaribacter tangerinus]